MSQALRIAFYAPFKPVGHPQPSGDLTIGTGLYEFLEKRGHLLELVSRLRTRWIYWKPWVWPWFLKARKQSFDRCRGLKPDLWLTYHSYYKAPDLFGANCSRRMGLPYVIFQGMYSTKRRKDWRTWAGFVLNRRALLAADFVFSNRKRDVVNLARLIPKHRLGYVVPGISPDKFTFDADAREQLRREWGVDQGVVVVTAAMFRPGIKSEGLAWVIRSCGELFRRQYPVYVAIAGDGKEKPGLRRLAERWLPGKVRFLGRVTREQMYRFYSAGDVFVFPGIRESLGMVYLEAQSCGLPVVAFADGGVPEVVANGVGGYLVRPFDAREFTNAIAELVTNPLLRRKMGDAGYRYVRQQHDLEHNYRFVEDILQKLRKRS